MLRFTVTQVRIAASCPRILHFDLTESWRLGLKRTRTTRIQKGSAESPTALGSLFHRTVEAFNDAAPGDSLVRDLVAAGNPSTLGRDLLNRAYEAHMPLGPLFRATGDRQEALMRTLTNYFEELASLIAHARSRNRDARTVMTDLFADRRRRLEVTLAVDPEGPPVRIVGVLDWIFHDWRIGADRIVDYKLTPLDLPSNDLVQVSVYALLHHLCHGTRPHAGVLYLYPDRGMVEMTWEQVHGARHLTYDLLLGMARWVVYDPDRGVGLKPPGNPTYCGGCPYARDGFCGSRLGDPQDGERIEIWEDRLASGNEPRSSEPRSNVRGPGESPGGARS